MSTAFGYRPQIAKGPPPPSVVPRERVYGRETPKPPLPDALAAQRAREREEDIAAAWAEGFRVAELLHGMTVTYETKPTEFTSMRRICEAVAAQYGLPVAELTSDRRTRDVVRARQEAMWRCRNETQFSLVRIGKYLGGRDHATVMNGIRRHEERMAREAKAG